MIRYRVIGAAIVILLLISTFLQLRPPGLANELSAKTNQKLLAQNTGKVALNNEVEAGTTRELLRKWVNSDLGITSGNNEKAKYQLSGSETRGGGSSGYHLGGSAYQVSGSGSAGGSPVEGLEGQYVFDSSEQMNVACPENDNDKAIVGELKLADWKSTFIAGQLALQHNDGPEAKKMFSLAETLIGDTDALAYYKKALCHLRMAQAAFATEDLKLATEEIEKARGYFSTNNHKTGTFWHSLAEAASAAEDAKLYPLAKPLWEECVDTSLELHPKTSIYVITAQTRLANNLYYQRDFKNAQRIYERVHRVMSFLIPEYGVPTFRNLLHVWQYTGRAEEAKQVEKLLSTVNTSDDDKTKDSYFAFLKKLPAGKHKARPDEDEIMGLYCEFFDDAHKLQRNERDWYECENQFKAALSALKFAGTGQQDYAWTVVALGSAAVTRQSPDAPQYLREALAKPNVGHLSQKQLVECHASLAVAEASKGHTETAVEEITKACAIATQTANKTDVFDTINSRIKTYAERGQDTGPIVNRMGKIVLTSIEKSAGTANGAYAGALYNFGRSQKDKEALPYFEKALSIGQSVLPADDRRIADASFWIGTIENRSRHEAKANEMFELSFSIRKKKPEDTSERDWSRLLSALRSSYDKLGRAQKLSELAAFERSLGREQFDGDPAYLCSVLARQEKTDEALAMYPLALKKQADSTYIAKMNVDNVLRPWAALAFDTNNFELAEQLEKRRIAVGLSTDDNGHSGYPQQGQTPAENDFRLATLALWQGQYERSRALFKLVMDQRQAANVLESVNGCIVQPASFQEAVNGIVICDLDGLNKPEEALTLIDQIYRGRVGISPELDFNRALCLDMLGKSGEARSAYDGVIKQFDSGRTDLDQNKIKAAQKNFQDIAAIEKKTPEQIWQLIESYTRMFLVSGNSSFVIGGPMLSPIDRLIVAKAARFGRFSPELKEDLQLAAETHKSNPQHPRNFLRWILTIQNQQKVDPKEIAATWEAMADATNGSYGNTDASSIYQKALEVAGTGDDSLDVRSRILQKAGENYLKIADFNSAKDSLNKAKELVTSKPTGDKKVQSRIFIDLGVVAEVSGDTKQAEAFFDEGLKNQQEDLYFTLAPLREVADRVHDAGNEKASESLLKCWVKLARSQANNESLRAALSRLGRHYTETKQWPQAKSALQEIIAISDAKSYWTKSASDALKEVNKQIH